MRDEVLRALCDPGEIADAELVDRLERSRECQPRRIGERLGPLCLDTSDRWLEPGAANRLGPLEVEAEQIAAVLAWHPKHANAR
jgi:hypothetical protein